MANAKSKTRTPRTPKKSVQLKKIFSLSNICFAFTIILIVTGGVILFNTIRKGGESAQEAYENAKKKAADEAYSKFYDTAFASAERKYHVSNKVSIEVASVREEANLEVLHVSDVEYVIVSKDKNESGLEAWLEYYGDGVYTVNMKASEFIIDADRQYVLVRVPRPELTNCRITKTNNLYLQEGGLFNKSYSDGEKLALEMRNEGYVKLNEYMKTNTKFYKSAKESATLVITDLVKGLNPELTDLVVEVEFVD